MNTENQVQKFVCSLPNEKNPGQKFKVKSEWGEKEGVLTILDSNNAWTGRIGEEQISMWSSMLEKSEDEYFQETKLMLTSSEESSSFAYALDKNSFVWKKKVEGGLKIKFGSITVESIPIQHIANEFIDILLTSNKKLNKRISALKSSLASHSTVQSNLRHRLETYPLIVAEEEKKLYENFLCILNAEKDTICSLHKKLDNRFNVKDVLLSHSSVLENFDENSKNQQTTSNNPYDSDTDVDTEDENDNEAAEVESNSTNSQKTNSQNSTENFGLDDSQNSPVLVLTKSAPLMKQTKIEPMVVDPDEPSTSSTHPPRSLSTESNNCDMEEPKEDSETTSNTHLMYSTQDLFNDL